METVEYICESCKAGPCRAIVPDDGGPAPDCCLYGDGTVEWKERRALMDGVTQYSHSNEVSGIVHPEGYMATVKEFKEIAGFERAWDEREHVLKLQYKAERERLKVELAMAMAQGDQ